MVFNVKDSERRRTIRRFPHEVEERNDVWIPLSDGKRLAATIWLPKDADKQPVPAILEYLPYRKNDFTAIRDSIRHPYFAGHGYASIRVDIRGTGDSDGYLPDEYTKQEQDDALEVFEWIQAQPWSTGSVGMIGKSWGGFNGLQIAARQHPALKAVITLCSTDDRYADDVHYRGGNILASDMLWWASTMFAYNARPQDPQNVGDSWRDNWLERLDKTPPFVEEWMRHQRRDAYWKHGSVCEDYSKVNIPVYAVGGWQDGYTNAVFRMVEHLPGPVKGLIGPWAHEYPEVATPEPAIGFLQECLRWWDQWLKEEETGIMDEPALTTWIQDYAPPQVTYDERPGKWVADDAWPSSAVSEEKLFINGDGLSLQDEATGSEDESVHVPSVQQHGLHAGVWCPFGQSGDLPDDQRLEDAHAVVLRTAPFSSDLELLGRPVLHASVSVNEENALLSARLSIKAPTGESTRISWGMLNLNHHKSHEEPEPLEPGKRYQISVPLDALGQEVPAGYVLELALSPAFWPQAWPSPKPVTVTLHPGDGTYLSLPVRESQQRDQYAGQFDVPETAEVMGREILRREERYRNVVHRLVDRTWELDDFSDEGERRLPSNGIQYGSQNRNTFTIREDDPLSAKVRCQWTLNIGRDDWQTKLVTDSSMTADKHDFYLENTITAYESDEEIFIKTWRTSVPRDFN
ncbi:CocE/NonD family hydrolase [Salisediminibacterium selenitireducens]|uniref:Peptidase S15 n=1 Tax=Bacillus selenitireducens (strain ATCC 700615 / DSM 15326 / MLS10) TaxID=439292 RepID=D6Y0K0_BACIE|nr:CocE/NonD family hydrolase [Salisediminibacterium selenitireducens]ADI00568.1 peptidase S15 [[Bacillus] selenitireducens MLS10]